MLKTPMAALLLALTLSAQPGVQQPPLHSDLLDQLAGFWAVNGTVRGQPSREGADGEWVLGHQFLRLHRKQIDGPNESLIHVGYDNVSERFVLIRLDSLSARGAETLGYGIKTGDETIQFTYEYPSGPYKETWTFDPKERSWQFQVESKDRQGKWITFSTLTLHRVPGGGGRRGPRPQ
jgi:hypothetical protein